MHSRWQTRGRRFTAGSFLRICAAGSALPITAGLAAGQSPSKPAAAPTAWKAGSYFPPSMGEWPRERMTPLLSAVSAERLRGWHDLLASEPHVAGSAGDAHQVERIAKAFTEMGLEVERHDFWAYLCRPVSAVLEIVEAGNARKPLILKEQILKEDLDSANPDLSWGWNAYSGSGDVTAEVVYANHGTKADYAKLKELGVDVAGKIVLCRYGGNFRGYKVKFAQAAGAAGVIIFTDPAKADPAKADPAKPEGSKMQAYPFGGAPNDSCIERGSIITTDYPGDPLTPGVEATKDADRLDPATVDLPRIPVQPIGWGPAREIMLRMAVEGEADDKLSRSPPLPEGWQGGLPVPYRIVGGPGVKLRLKVEQTREIVKTTNIIGTLRGKDLPDEWVLVGSHHDAWGFGACDPTSGTICTMEAAAVFAEAAGQGSRPRRTMKFCAWGAEEFGIIGSTEWVESRTEELAAKGVAYINLDASVLGVNFGASAAPSLKTLITEVTRHVPSVGAELAADGSVAGPTVFDTWITREPDAGLPGQPKFGDLGGGSDHVAFWCRAGVPSAGLGSSGAPGSAYHSVYDTLRWYRQNVGDDYEPARMVTRVVVGTIGRLAHDGGLDPERSGHDVAVKLSELAKRVDAKFAGKGKELEELAAAAERYASVGGRARSGERVIQFHASSGQPGSHEPGVGAVNDGREVWSDAAGLPGRPWYRNSLAAPDETFGYASWVLPEFMHAIEREDGSALDAAIVRMRERLARLNGAADRDTHRPNETHMRSVPQDEPQTR